MDETYIIEVSRKPEGAAEIGYYSGEVKYCHLSGAAPGTWEVLRSRPWEIVQAGGQGNLAESRGDKNVSSAKGQYPLLVLVRGKATQFPQ